MNAVAPRAVAVIGLGFMGVALARALNASDFHVHAWTRSASRRNGLLNEFSVRPTAVEAINAAKVIVLCITNFAASKEFLELPGIAAMLEGKTIVQLTSESPEEARQFSAMVAQIGGSVLDGAIATMPNGIGRQDAVIYYSGDRAVFDREQEILSAMSGRPVYCGADPGDASSMDMAWLSFFYGASLGLVQGIAICRAAKLDPSVFLKATPSYVQEIVAMSVDFERQTRIDDFSGDQSSMLLHLGGAEQVLALCSRKGLDTRLPQAAVEIIQRAIDAGFANLELAVAAKVMQSERRQ